jgi:succinate-acetate transporter protein
MSYGHESKYPPIARAETINQSREHIMQMPSLPNQSVSASPLRKIANPGPLGLMAFATTTLLLSMFNAQARGIKVPNVIVGMAAAYGGFAQILAGMWEYTVGNTFGATAFTSYGSFWISFAFILLPGTGIIAAFESSATPPVLDAVQLDSALGLFLVVWFVVTSIFLIASFRTTWALVSLFLILDITFFVLAIGHFCTDPTTSANVIKIGGILGCVTAFDAYYNALAGMLDNDQGKFRLPVGKRS